MIAMSNRIDITAKDAEPFDKLVSVAHQYDAIKELSFGIYWRRTEIELD